MIRGKGAKIKTAGLAALIMALALSGCGQTSTSVDKGDIALLEPDGVALNYEEATYRNLYDEKVCGGLVYPYTEVYQADHGMNVQRYGAFVGDEVKKGDTLLLANTENLEKSIKEKKEYLAQMQEEYNEYWTDQSEKLEQQKADENYYNTIVTQYEAKQPQQYLTQTDENGNTVQVENPEYTQWNSNASYHDCKTKLMSSTAQVQQTEEAMRQRAELFELDLNYQKLLLKRLQEDLSNETIQSGMSGVVTGMKTFSDSAYVREEDAVMAVSDLNQKYLKTEYISKIEIGKAVDVYALVNGKRVEVEYQPMENEEYARLKDQNRKVYSSFRLLGDGEQTPLGSYGVIVVKKQVKEQVLTIPQSAITWEENTATVYILKDGSSQSVPIQVGMKDGFYAEVLSGIEPGEKIVTEGALTAGSKTVKLEKGSVQNSVSVMGRLEYPSYQYITNPVKYGTTYLVETKMKNYQSVKKGDVLMTIRVEPDTIGLETKQRELQRAKERLEDTKADHKGDTSKEYLKYLENENEKIAELEKVIQEMKEDFATTEIKAPVNGVILGYWGSLPEGTLLSTGSTLARIAEDSTIYVAFEDTNSQVSFGMEAKIEFSDDTDQNHTVSGTVVTVNQNIFEKDLNRESLVLIQVSADEVEDMATSSTEIYWNPSRFNVTIETRRMDNVVLVPKRAVTATGSATYVKLKKENGEVIYQSFVAGGSDNSYYWVVDGLTEGMEVCIE